MAIHHRRVALARWGATALLALVAVLAAGPALAWGPAGHRFVAAVAERFLGPETARTVRELLVGAGGGTLRDVAHWAADQRRTRPETDSWHYVAIPLGADAYDAARDCAEDRCAVAQIERLGRVLADPRAAPRDRAEALMFLVGLVADLHQPLHCADNRDSHGKDLKVRFFGKPSTLHAVWDEGIVARLGTPDLLEAHLAAIEAKDVRAWAEGTPITWATESHLIAQRIAYGLLPGGAHPEIGQAYQAAAGPIVSLQLQRAAVRLAAVLNGALEPAQRELPKLAPATRSKPSRD